MDTMTDSNSSENSSPSSMQTPKAYTLSRILRHTFTGVDNKTIDIGRVLWFMGAVSFIIISGYFVWKTGQWNPLEWGSGFAAVNGGSGLATKLKEASEPKTE